MIRGPEDVKKLSKKNKYGEKAFTITVRLPVSLKDKLGGVPSDKVGSIVCAYYNYTKAVIDD